MAKKLLVLIIFIVLTLLCALWSPWNYWDISIAQLAGVQKPPEFARLQVSSLAGEVEIYVDDESYGSVGPEGSPFLIEDIKPGKRLVRLERRGDGKYINLERLIDFYTEVDTVIAYELGPNTQFSEGHFITAFKNAVNRDKVKLNVFSEPNGSTVFLDGKELGKTPLENIELDITKVHQLQLKKDGYEPQSVSLLPGDEEDRKSLKGFDINVEARLFLLPLRVD